MRITFISVVGLHRSLTRRIDFHDRLNLIVGINGSGKTSILNCIDWLLKPDLVNLSVTDFDSIELGIIYKGNEFTLRAVKTDTDLHISRIGGENLAPIHVSIVHKIAGLRHQIDVSELRQIYTGLGPEDHERALWQFISSLPSPLTILLDRSISTDTSEGVYFDPGSQGRSRKDRKVRSPLEKVADVTRERYGIYREQLIALNDRLKDRMIVSTFRNPFDSRSSDAKRKVSLNEITRLERKVASLLASSIGTDESQSMIASYFQGAKEFARISANDDKLKPIFWTQFRQIGELADGFDEYEQKSSLAYERIGSFLRTLNVFFKESKKSVLFNDHNGSLSFQYLDEAGNPSGEFKSIEALSSGEKQILIMLTFLAFVSERNRIFVVDEPELSLHPRWQENFLEAVISQAPEGTQIILATHSPEIVAKHRSNCIVLVP